MWYMHYLCRLTKEVYLTWWSAPAGWSSCTPRDSRVAGSVRLAGIYRPRWSVVEWFESVLDAGYIGEFGGAARRPFVLRRGSSSSLACGYNLVGHQGGQVDCQLQQSFQSYNISANKKTNKFKLYVIFLCIIGNLVYTKNQTCVQMGWYNLLWVISGMKPWFIR